MYPERSDRSRAWLAIAATVLALAALVTPVTAPAQIAPLEDLAKFPQEKLEISDGKGAKKSRHRFDIWVADTPARQTQGLMFVRSLPEKRGMLFIYDEPRIIGMWMKNTYIPLDMVFIDAQGRILQIAENTTPHSLDIVRGKLPAKAVLEIGGGEARRLGLKPGYRVHHPAFEGSPAH